MSLLHSSSLDTDRRNRHRRGCNCSYCGGSSFIYPLTAGLVGAPQRTPQPVSFIVLCSPLLSDTSHLFFCLPGLLLPFTVPCKMVLARPDEREIYPHHCSLRLFTMVRRSSCGPIACWILAQTSSLVTWSLYEMRSILLKHLIFMARILLWSSAVRVHDSRTYRKMDVTRERIIRILKLKICSCRSKLVSTLSMLLSSVSPGEYLRLGTIVRYN